MLIAVLLSSTACTSLGGQAAPEHSSGHESGREASGSFWDGIDPAPESTVTPPPDAAEGVAVPEGYEVAVVARRDDPTASTLVEATRAWAEAHGATATVREVTDENEIERALLDETTAADVVVGVGPGVVDVFSLLTAQMLDRQFLMLGAQLAEPTKNVTAVVWPGASFRGTGISETDSDTGSGTTTERAESGVATGIAAILAGRTGIVLQLG
ncbi:BMP family ABC transporter substrate-binding protein [Microbacteriaceae bacterium 4G12]